MSLESIGRVFGPKSAAQQRHERYVRAGRALDLDACERELAAEVEAWCSLPPHSGRHPEFRCYVDEPGR